MQSTVAAVAGLPAGTDAAMKAVLDELQAYTGGAGGPQVSLVNGTTAATNIAVTGIKTGDVLTAVIELVIAADTGTSATGNKVTSAVKLADVSITSNGNIQSSGTNTSGNQLLVFWVKNT